MAADEVRFDLCNVNSVSRDIVRVVQFKTHNFFTVSSSSTESAHANTDASVSGNCLHSSGKSMECVSKNGIFSNSENSFDLEYFCKIGVGLRYFSPGRTKSRGNCDLEDFFQKRRGKKNWTWNSFVQESKRERRSKVKQVRKGVRSPVR